MENKKWITYGLLGAALLVVALLTTCSLTSASQSPDEILREAYELRTKARRAHCTTIVQRMNDCYTAGEATACQKMQESFTWFQNEYGEPHELACPKNDLPFGVGGQE